MSRQTADLFNHRALPASTIDRGRLPNAICIGGQRCGTSWLGRTLGTHPDVFHVPGEPSIFNRVIRIDGFEAAYKLFADATIQKIRFEKTPTYSAMYPEEVAFTRAVVPDLKIIFVIRNPVDRIWSSITRSWSFRHIGNQHPTKDTIVALSRAVENGLTCRLTNYARTIAVWKRYFPDRQILLLRFDEIQAPRDFLNKISDFLTIDASAYDVNHVNRRINATKSSVPDIPEWLSAYLAARWCPMLRELETIAQIDMSDWIGELSELSARSTGFKRLVPTAIRSIYSPPYGAFTWAKRLARRKTLEGILATTMRASLVDT